MNGVKIPTRINIKEGIDYAKLKEAVTDWNIGEGLIIPPNSDLLDDFGVVVWETAIHIAQTIILKDRKYDGAYRKLRKYCLEKYGDPNIPLDIHTYEKKLRQGASNDDEDAEFDELGYHFLDYVCRKLDDKENEQV